MSEKEDNHSKKRPVQRRGVWARTEALANSPGVRRPESENRETENLGKKETTAINTGTETNGVVNGERDEYSDIEQETNEYSDIEQETNEYIDIEQETNKYSDIEQETYEYSDIEEETLEYSDIEQETNDFNIENLDNEEKADINTGTETNGVVKGERYEYSDIEQETNDLIIATSELNPFAEEFYPNSEGYVKDNYPTSEEEDTTTPYEEDEGFISQLNDAMSFYYNQISQNPAMFDITILELKPYLDEFVKRTSKRTAHAMAEELMQMSIVEPEFAYFAVKLTCYMIKNQRELTGKVGLRDAILAEVESRVEDLISNVLVNSDADTSKILPLLMFLSELYLQLEVKYCRLAPLGEAVIDICKVLTEAEHIPIAERLTHIVSAIKLTGRFLEEHASVKLNVLMGPLWIYADRRRAEIGEDIFKLVDDLSELRYTHKWNPPSTSQGNGSHEVNNQEAEAASANYDEVICYGPDGNVLSKEELLFLDCYSEENSPDLSDLSPTGMDNEMYFAYEEFLVSIQLDQEPNPQAQCEDSNYDQRLQ